MKRFVTAVSSLVAVAACSGGGVGLVNKHIAESQKADKPEQMFDKIYAT